MQAYSDPSREDDPHALPDVEIFYIEDPHGAEWNEHFGSTCDDPPPACLPGAPCAHEGYYWWSCFPGCLPDGEPNGPFDTLDEALADARGTEE
jgi:hypothetical protein